MAENKTQKTKKSVEIFIKTIKEAEKQSDCFTLLEMMRRITGEEPKMWGPSIIGFGDYHYKYESGREGDYFITGFSPRKQNLTIYIMPGFGMFEDLLPKLGKFKTSVSCLYIKKLEDINIKILESIIEKSYNYMLKKYPRAKNK